MAKFNDNQLNSAQKTMLTKEYREYVILNLTSRLNGVKGAPTAEQWKQMHTMREMIPVEWFTAPGSLDVTQLDVLATHEHYPADMTMWLKRVREGFVKDYEENEIIRRSALQLDVPQGRGPIQRVHASKFFGTGKALSTGKTETKSPQEPQQESKRRNKFDILPEGTSYFDILSPYFPKRSHRSLSYLVTDDMQFTPGAMDACIDLLEELRSKGIAYELSGWEQKGALQVQLMDSKALVQVLHGEVKEPYDAKAKEKAEKQFAYIGQVRDNGRFYRFRRGAEGGAIAHPTHDQRKELLEFALGENKKPYEMTFNQKNSDATVTNFRVKSPSGTQFIVESDTRFHLPFKNAIEAESYIRDALENAKAIYADGLELSQIKEAIQSENPFEVTNNESLQTVQFHLYQLGVRAKALDEAGALNRVNAHNPEDSIYDADDERFITLNPDAYVETKNGWEMFFDTYASAVMDSNLHSYDQGFDPVWAASLLDTNDVFLNKGEVLIEALRMCKYDPDKLIATDKGDFYARRLRDKLVTFDPATGKNITSIEDPFGKQVLLEARETLLGAGLEVEAEDVQIDANGVLHWRATRDLTPENKNAKKRSQVIEGELGQIFLPDDNGAIITKFGGSENYETIPGYRAYLLPKEEDSDKDTFRERHRVVGYQEQMLGAMKRALRLDALSNVGYGQEAVVHNTTGLNAMYGRLYDHRYEIGSLDRAVQTGDLPASFANAIRHTLAGRVRYDRAYDESTTNAASMEEIYGLDEIKDVYSPYEQTGRRNLRVMDTSMDGIFDPQATGGAYNQGTVRYLTEDASVLEGGILSPGTKEYCALLAEPEFQNCIKYNQWDRVVMALQQALTAKRIDHKVGTAMMGFGGFNMEDGYVVSREFAERNSIEDGSGTYRPLRRGDKISDFNGNKGVIGLIVDRNKTAKEQTVVPELPFPEEAVTFFKDNPDVDVVLSPYSPISRANGGAIRDLASDTADLYVNGKTVKGAVGFTNFIITDKTVDEKTKLYDEPDGSIGRKISGSLAWAIDSAGCTAIKDFVYGGNLKAIEDFREYLIAVGLDMAADGTILPEYTAHAGEDRNVFSIAPPDVTSLPVMNAKEENTPFYSDAGYGFADVSYDQIVYKTHNRGQHNDSLEAIRAYEGPSEAFLSKISDQGGFLEVPWPLEYYTDVASPSKRLQEIKTEDGRIVYHLPILAPELRNAQAMQDGEVVAHNFTRRYEQLYTNVYDHYRLSDMIARRKKDFSGVSEYLDSHLEQAWAPHGGLNRLEELKNQANAPYTRTNMASRNAGMKALNAIWSAIGETNPEIKNAYDAKTRYEKNLADWSSELERLPEKAQRSFTAISKTVADQYINGKRDKGKNSFLRDNIMGRKMSNTATCVCIPDPRLDLDTVSMNRNTMKALGLTKLKKKEVLLWRDPIVKDGGVRYFKVIEDPSVDGVGINPVVARSFAMDFDGDAAGLLHITNDKAKEEAREKLVPSVHMLDTGVKKDGRHPLYFGLDQDIQMSIYESKGQTIGRIGDMPIDMGEYLNQIETRLNTGAMSGEQGFSQLNAFVKKAYQKSFGASPLRFEDFNDLHEDFERIIDAKAKGSAGKRDTLYYWMGVSQETDGKVVDNGGLAPDIRQRRMQSQAATAMKTDDTGIAGTYTQRLVQVFRNFDIKMAMESTEPITQGVLSIKGNAAHGKRIDRILRKDLKNVLYEGVAASTEPKEVKKARHLSKDQFIAELQAVLTDEECGLGVKTNPDYIKKLAHYLSNDKGQIRPLKEMPCSPMDRVAYSNSERIEEWGDTDKKLLITPLMRFRELAEKKENLFGPPTLSNGRVNYNYHFAPHAVREADQNTCIAKASTQRKDIQVEVENEVLRADFDEARIYAKERTIEVPDVPFVEEQGELSFAG